MEVVWLRRPTYQESRRRVMKCKFCLIESIKLDIKIIKTDTANFRIISNIAQLVERQIFNLNVIGSSPIFRCFSVLYMSV